MLSPRLGLVNADDKLRHSGIFDIKDRIQIRQVKIINEQLN